MHYFQRLWLWLCLLILSALLPSCDDEAPVTADNPFLKLADEAPLIVAHRGGKGLFPENTLVAYRGGLDLGVDVLEIDVCLTADDILVAIHDLTIDRTCEGSGAVLQYSHDELRAFNFGYEFQAPDGSFPYRDDPVRIPSIEEIFIAFPETRMIIEIKTPGYHGKRAAEILYQAILDHDMKDYISVFSFEQGIVERFHTINEAGLHSGASIIDVLEFLGAVADGDLSEYSPMYEVMSVPLEFEGLDLGSDEARFIDGAHQKGLAIHYWTINDRELMRRLILAGADGIITDYPDRMIEVLDELGF